MNFYSKLTLKMSLTLAKLSLGLTGTKFLNLHMMILTCILLLVEFKACLCEIQNIKGRSMCQLAVTYSLRGQLTHSFLIQVSSNNILLEKQFVEFREILQMNNDRHVHFAKSQSDEILRFAASIEQIHSERGHSSQTFVATRNHLVQRIFTVRV